MRYVEHTYVDQQSATQAADAILMEWERDKINDCAHSGHIDIIKMSPREYHVCVYEFDQPVDGVI